MRTLLIAILILISSFAFADEKLLQPSDVTYLGAFKVTHDDLGGPLWQGLQYGGGALAFNPAHNSLIISTMDQRVVEIQTKTPRFSGYSTAEDIIHPYTDITEGNGHWTRPSKEGPVEEYLAAGHLRIGGLLTYGDKLIASLFAYYDPQGDMPVSHMQTNINLNASGDFQGPYLVNPITPVLPTETYPAGIVDGYMTTIPDNTAVGGTNWQTALGGKILTGNSDADTIERTSFGPGTAFAFDPANFSASTPAVGLLYYDGPSHLSFGEWGHPDVVTDPPRHSTTYANIADRMAGMSFPDGTRSIIFIGSHSSGDQCYGFGVTTGSLNNPVPPISSEDSSVLNCYDLSDSGKGTHGYPYSLRAYIYDAAMLARVKAGDVITDADVPNLVGSPVTGQVIKPWNLKPYTYWDLPITFGSNPGPYFGASAYDAATHKLYVSQPGGDNDPVYAFPLIHVFQINTENLLLTVGTSSLGAGTTGIVYSQTLSATGGLAPYTWSVASGSLPTGLTLATASGVISGTPTTAGTSSFTVQAQDTNGTVASKALTISVYEPVDSTAPTVSVAAPANNATVSGTVAVSVSAADNVGVTRAELYVNGVLYATVTTAPYNFSWDSTSQTNGSCALIVKAYDAAGNIGQSTTVTVNVQNGALVLLRTGWKITYVDSQELVGENGAATNVLDGDQATLWHTQYDGASPPPPHELQIDLGAYYDLSGFRYLPRQDGSPNGRIGQYEFYASMDGVNWGTAAATGTFANSASEKEVTFTARTARYARLRALTEVNGNVWTSMAELNILGKAFSGNLPPDGAITSPSSNVTINAGDTVQFTGAGNDPDANLPLSYRWNFGTGSGIADASVKDPGAVQFLVAGTYTVTFTVTDGLGAVDPTPASIVVTVRRLLPVIPRIGWTLHYVDSQETSGEDGAATNAFDGSTATIWHTQWSGASPPCPHEIQIDLGATRTVGGFRYLPRQDGGVNGMIGQYEFYLSGNGVTWGTAVATGVFAADTTEKEVIFPQQSARYIRLRALTEINGNPWTSAAEVNVLDAE
jgi:hypothetical protein